MNNKRLLYSMVLLVGMLCLHFPHATDAHIHHHHEMPNFQTTPNNVEAEDKMLQLLVDATPAGGTLILGAKNYNGSVTISKPITIKGVEDTVILSSSTAFTITNTENVVLENLKVEAKDVALLASGVQGLTLRDITIDQGQAGIQMTDSASITMEQLTVNGDEAHFSTKGHAVAIYKSKQFQASDSKINNVMDGFYLEEVEGISLQNNQIENSRYAIHMMFSNDVDVTNNYLLHNMTGFMMMITDQIHMANNTITKNNTLNSLGVYSYDVDGLTFVDNELRENTIAMNIESTRNMVITDNLFSTNGTVLEVKKSPTLKVEHNEFYGNILTVRSDEEGLILQRNIYDDYTGKDYDGDEIGDTTYIATNSFGQWMARKPVYQYFIEAPSVVVLNSLDTEITGGSNLVVTDEEPVVMKQQLNTGITMNWWQFSVSAIILITILIIRRKWL